ncbi:PLAC8 family protein [Raphanus sativus]|nr:PLAC8 family protein [Raphanus sativus]
MTEERDEEVSRSPNNFRAKIKEIKWASLAKTGKQWLRNPLNMALFLWILVVAVSGAILFMVMTGMLNALLPNKSQRDVWFEVNNQILNALFTLMCLYQHPKRFYHLVLLSRWKQPDDVTALRKVYCEKGTQKPNEWTHMMVVVLLLHLNCFAQYALCGLNLGFRRSERPPVGVAICVSVAIAAPAAAGLYTILSPLGKEYDHPPQGDEENQVKLSLERRYSFASRDDDSPEWRGGVLDIWEDLTVSYLSLLCTFCVFGWNMERIGFGNMYVHIATFILFCLAPFFIFNLAAINIDNEMVREGLGYAGIVLCLFGLLYGWFWRIQMRKRFRLPSYNFCCGRPAVADCTLWLFCCWCSLAQEVRTASFYEIVEDRLCKRREEVIKVDDEDGVMDPSCLGEKMKTTTMASSSLRQSTLKGDEALSPPSPPFIHREAT